MLNQLEQHDSESIEPSLKTIENLTHNLALFLFSDVPQAVLIKPVSTRYM